MGIDFDPQTELDLARATERDFRMSAPSTRDAAVQANQERTVKRFTFRVLLPLFLIGLGIILGTLTANASHSSATEQPADSIPPCSAYAYTSTPDLHGARTDACYTQNPDGGYSVSTGDAVQTAAW